MQHTIEDLIRRINVMHDKAVELHRVRNQYSEISDKTYDKQHCKVLIGDIQSLALGIAMDKEGDDVKTEMDEWKYTQKRWDREVGYGKVPDEYAVEPQERYHDYMLRRLRETEE
jgi:GTP-sensing pleiotropic transcriptional regulator CodY